MKKTLFTLVVVFIATFSLSGACTDDTEDLIIGKWQETEATIQETIDGEVLAPESLLEPGDVSIMTFKKDHTFTSSLTSEGIETSSSGTWSIEDNKITMIDNNDYFDFGPQTFNIDEIDENHLVLSSTESGTEDGMSITVTYRIKMEKL